MMQDVEVAFGPRRFRWGKRTYVMGVLNVTRDSFSDGGRYFDPDRARARARQIVEEGADILDVGAESARLAAEKLAPDEEIDRLAPLVEWVARHLDVAISVDTYKAPVAEAALRAGAHIVNDISGLHADPAMAPVVARHGAGVVLMHLQGTARRPAEHPAYRDVVEEVLAYLRQACVRARQAGIDPSRILVDPGIGVGKLTEHNLALLRAVPEIKRLGHPVLVGHSRTSVIGNLIEAPIGERLEGTLGATAALVALGADVVRVHDVGANVRAARVADAILRGWQPPWEDWSFDAVTGEQRRPLHTLRELAARD
ncbi:dihydropteroate synthase [Carboxydochorda subterranea]|uniref:Dihydropteroate synthase n=1 Tax=Carboxydichorda subterranea TaxID=3109565 RepID=A0ABZ1BW22_9FIRM|nr:dihydropteroate synthase [Limnochorda sp. L945t]WRP16874.1 dihydropteroate synthase [Limnochorda sp. L945t]